MREIISQLNGSYSRPTERGQHPTLHPSRDEGSYKLLWGKNWGQCKIKPTLPPVLYFLQQLGD